MDLHSKYVLHLAILYMMVSPLQEVRPNGSLGIDRVPRLPKAKYNFVGISILPSRSESRKAIVGLPASIRLGVSGKESVALTLIRL
jgi:hypothetical protein